MRIIPIFLIITLAFLTNAAAQSGRKVRTPTAVPVSTPQVQQTQDATVTQEQKEEESAGYSESAPNAPRSISAKPRKDKKANKDAKNDAKVQQPTQPASTPKTEGDEEEVIKVETSLVTIPVSVYDRNGLYIPNLQKQNFKVFENGAEQEIAYFGTSEQPFTVVLLIDVSPSTAYKIEEIQAAAAAFVEQLLPKDQVMVIEFDASVHVLTEVTGDRDKIYKAIRRTGFGDGTSLYEAVDFSLRKRLDKIEGRKAIVLFTDGVDTSSVRADFENTVREAEESEAIIFPIYYNTFLNSIGVGGGGGVMSSPPIINLPRGGQGTGMSSAEYTRGRAYLTELANATGGKVFRPESTPGGLTAAFEGIAEELRRQYNIGYYPSDTGSAGDRKQIKVRVDRPHLVIRSRDSYIVGGAEGS